jgi:bifunctional non-homologous end joining protein LigD
MVRYNYMWQDSQFFKPAKWLVHVSRVHQAAACNGVDQPPPRAGWIHEVKHDGYRTVLIIDRRKASAYTCNGFDWTERYPGITKAAGELGCRSAIIDGEVIVQNEHGHSDFDALKSAIRWRPQSLILCAFDLLHLNGKDLRDRPLLERRARLKELVPSEHPFLFSEEFTGDASAFFRACADHQLEGIVSKLASSKYRSGRSKTWLKTKCFAESSFVIIGTARDLRQKLLWRCWPGLMRRAWHTQAQRSSRFPVPREMN